MSSGLVFYSLMGNALIALIAQSHGSNLKVTWLRTRSVLDSERGHSLACEITCAYINFHPGSCAINEYLREAWLTTWRPWSLH